MITQFFPKITDYRNEVVFYLGVAATVVLGVIEIVEGIDLASVDSYIAAVPLVLSLFQRAFAYGPKTVEREYVRVS